MIGNGVTTGLHHLSFRRHSLTLPADTGDRAAELFRWAAM